MDVQKVNKAGLNKINQKKQGVSEKVSFQEVMQKGRDEKKYEQLSAMMKEIEKQGKTLSENRTVEEFRKYKKMVKEFMEDAVEFGLNLEERRGFNRRGRTKIYKIVKTVDQKLIDLANEVLNKEKKQLDILNSVGEIQGLIINLYT
ncbi:YaaR family protein [Bacillus tianshenii]|nr:YaaR family protein [Bacillus tianshenii]